MSILTGNWFGFGRGAAGPTGPTVTSGGTEYTPGNGYKYHVFTYPNTEDFTKKDDTTGNVQVLLIAGGGGGGGYYGAGGGAGGLVFSPSPWPLSPGTYPVTIGDGGGGADSPSQSGTSGEDSTFGAPDFHPTDGAVTAKGGGGGGAYVDDGGGFPGGSGGGKGSKPGGPWPGNVATQPTESNPPSFNNYGYPGGTYGTSLSGYAPAGGGGAGAAGVSPPSNNPGGGNGGDGHSCPGFEYPIVGMSPYAPAPESSPTNDHYGGGGGACLWSSAHPDRKGEGGLGGGGYGSNSPTLSPTAPINGWDGLGGGGGGSTAGSGGDGGSGICIIRYTV